LGEREAAVRAALASGTGIRKTARLGDTGNATVARIAAGMRVTAGSRPRNVSMHARIWPAIPPASRARLLGSAAHAGAGAVLMVSLSREILERAIGSA
jgi:hypothetical protein